LKISPNYDRLAFTQTDSAKISGIVVLDLNTGKSWPAAPGLGGPTWSPDQKIMIASQLDSAPADSAAKEGALYFVIKPEGGSQKKISLAESLPQSSIVTIDWSRDGKRIAFDTVTILNELNLMKNFIPKGQK